MTEISDILLVLTSKQTWYSKIFDDAIVEKWREETEDKDDFELALRILRTTAQGCVHLVPPMCDYKVCTRKGKKCEWNSECCEECKLGLLEEGKTNYSSVYRYESYEEFVENIYDIYSDEHTELEENCRHERCSCVAPDSLLEDYIVYKKNSFIQKDLKKLVLRLEEAEVDYHPELLSPTESKKGIVRDLVHPSLYCYVKGVSCLKDGSVEEEIEDSVKYQWLPSEVRVNGDKVKFKSYINNFEGDTSTLERALSSFLPSLRTVLKKDKLTKLQVIVKLASISLEMGEEYEGGSWHIEGMPYEYIVATCLQYVEMKVENSYLEFRKPVWINEEHVEYDQGDENYTKKHFGLERHYDGKMNRYLGLIRCEEGKGVVFPNTLQHRVKGFSGPGRRTILAFFVVDPDNRILSTEDVPRQQGVLSREDAEKHRIALMVQRKYFVDLLNEEVYEREYSLCEH